MQSVSEVVVEAAEEALLNGQCLFIVLFRFLFRISNDHIRRTDDSDDVR